MKLSAETSEDSSEFPIGKACSTSPRHMLSPMCVISLVCSMITVRCFLAENWRTLNPRTLNPRTLNPRTLNPRTLNPRTLNLRTLNLNVP